MYLGIDLGTSSVKVLLVDDKGDVIGSNSREYPLLHPHEGWSEQNPTDWWEATKETIKTLKCKDELSKVEALSFSGQMHGLVTLDGDDRVIRPAILWNDQRTIKECEFLNNHNIAKYTGNTALTGFTAPKLLWVKNNEPDNFKKIKKIMLPKDYLVYKFCGVHAIDASDASGTLFLDPNKRAWSPEALSICSISQDKLGKVYEAHECVGVIDKGVASELGLSESVKIIAGGGDQCVGAIGVGAVEEGIFSVALGTSGVVFAPLDNYLVDKEYRLHSFCHVDKKYHQMGVMLSAMGSYKWWVEKMNTSTDYEKFNQLATLDFDELQKMKNLYFLPYLTGERTPHNNPSARGHFLNLSITSNQAHCTRAVLEGIAFGLRDSYELVLSLGITPKEVRISGGGSKSELFREILATVLKVEVITMNSSEGPAYGASLLAMVGSGKYPSVKECCEKLIKKGNITKPRVDLIDYYDEKYQGFKEQYQLIYS